MSEQQQLQFPGFPEKPIENYWQYPKIVNGFWHQLTGAEQKVLDYILRHTWGYNKNSDTISRQQFQYGIKKRDGEWLDKGTGLTQPSISRALRGLVDKGFILRSGRRGKKLISEYTLRLIKNEQPPSKEMSNHPPKKMSNPCTINTDTINTNTIPENANAFSDKDRKELIDLFKEVNPNYQILFNRRNQGEALKRMVLKFGREKVENTIKALSQIINKPFAPRITSPIQLENKLGELVAFYNQEKGKVVDKSKIKSVRV